MNSPGEDVGEGKNNGVVCLFAACCMFGGLLRLGVKVRAMTSLFETTFDRAGGDAGKVAIAGTESDLIGGLRLGRGVDGSCAGGDADTELDGSSSILGWMGVLGVVVLNFGSDVARGARD